MNTIRRAASRTVLTAALLVGAAGCSEKFLNVTNPNVIDAATVDPVTGATTLAGSAQQNFATAYGLAIMYSSWFTGETLVMETFPTRNEFGIRTVSDNNGNLNGDVWSPLQLAAASTKLVLDLALPTPASNLNRARVAAFRGFSILFLATDFCSITLSSGPELTTNQALDSAIFWFGKAMDIGNANGTADGKALAAAALVGRARAYLQRGNKTAALADANNVPAGFIFNLNYTDDIANRARLGNNMWIFTFDRGSIGVAPAWQVSDPRVPYLQPTPNLPAFDASFSSIDFPQQKYPGYAAPIRIASKLEADYIAAEASSDPVQELALINRERTANGLPAYSGATDAAAVLTELYNQRGFEFYLEGKRLADFRRQPAATLNMPQPGAAYFKPGFPPIGNQSCYPLPKAERDNNPNFKTP
jgi:hypothetical protein